jgi:hypothetical protein
LEIIVRETHREKVERVIEITDSIKCDRCGKEMCLAAYHAEGTTFTLDFGYGSRFDLERVEIDTCDDCAEWLRGEFKTADVTRG